VSSSTKPGRRVERTRQDILSAFRALLFESGYPRMSVRSIIERANVGRSTFYEHFGNKEDVLRETLTHILAPLADAVAAHQSPAKLEAVVRHMSETRAMTGAILLGPSRRIVQRFLAELLETRIVELRVRRPNAAALLPPPIIAAFLAEAQLSLITLSLAGKDGCAPESVARALSVTTKAVAKALLG
jgi:AcrR family transcriptional regulator